MIGSKIAQFEITAKIGEGGMGEVYKATDTKLRREVALKFLPEYLAQDETAQLRFVREARSAAAIDHPYICKIYEVGEAEGKSFIAMEYVDGQTLKQKRVEGPIPLKEVLRIASDIGSAVEKAHRAGIVHRDLKPENIMLTEEGHVKVMDFGLAKRVEREDEEITAALTREGTTLGTLNYMSPEQLKAQPVDHRSDIFSFGVLLYEMLTGVHPFWTGTQAETIHSILNENPSPLSHYTEEAPDLLQHTLEKMLAKDAEERYPSIREVGTNLKKVAEGFSVRGMTWVGESALRKGVGSGLLKWGLGVVVAAVLAVVATDWLGPWWQRLTFDAEASSVAILPLANISEDPDYSDHLAKGISQDVIEKLGQIGLRVTPWQTVQQFASSIEEPQEIARQLQVKNVLHGSFEDQGERIVASLSLMELDQGLFHWIEEFQEPYENLFRLEQQIASKIATSLKGELTAEEKATLALSRSSSLDAYENYLTGAHILQEGVEEATRLALDYFTEAIKLDPQLALAHIGIGGVYQDFYYYGWGGLDLLEAADQSFETALRLDPTSMTAWRAVIMQTSYMKGKTIDALDLWQKASQYGRIDDVETLLTRARAYRFSPLIEEAEPSLRRVIELDPINQEAHFMLLISLYPEKPKEAIIVGETILERFSQPFPLAYLRLGNAYQLLGRLQKARQFYEVSMKKSPPNMEALLIGGILLHELGEKDEAEAAWRRGIEMIEPKIRENPDNVGLHTLLACYHGLLEDRESFVVEEKRALDFKHNDWTLELLATVHLRLGDMQRGIEILQLMLDWGRVQPLWKESFSFAFADPPPDSEAFRFLIESYETQAQRIREVY